MNCGRLSAGCALLCPSKIPGTAAWRLDRGRSRVRTGAKSSDLGHYTRFCRDPDKRGVAAPGARDEGIRQQGKRDLQAGAVSSVGPDGSPTWPRSC